MDLTEALLQGLWNQWQRALEYGYATQAREYREMYLALLDRQTAGKKD